MTIKKVAVIGAGTMGAGIAGQVANAGVTESTVAAISTAAARLVAGLREARRRIRGTLPAANRLLVVIIGLPCTDDRNPVRV